jgi:tetratricopeptide (TPR) repeat protein
LDPSNTDGAFVGVLYAAAGLDTTSALQTIEKAIELDPLTEGNWLWLGYVHFYDGNFRAAVQVWREHLGYVESSAMWLSEYAMLVALSGDISEAVQIADQVSRMPGLYADLALFMKHAWLGERKQALETITQELEIAAHIDEFTALQMAESYALIGEPDHAFHWLEHAIDCGLCNVPFLSEHDPFLAPLRSDSRFDALMDNARRLCASLRKIS